VALFHYTARNPQGEAQHGTLEADSSGSVAEHLFGSSLTPIEIREVEPETSRPGLSMPSWRRSSVRLEELVMLCRQLHTLLKAGVPILRGLDGLAETTRNTTLAETLKDLSTDIQSGRELHQALSRHRKIFSPLFVSLIEVGEQTGRLDEAFRQLASYLELERETRARIKSATRYPLVVLGAIFLAVVIINIWVIPAFADTFARFDAELPWATRLLLGVSDFTVQWWPMMLVAAALGLAGLRLWIRTETGGYVWSRWLLQMPLVGHIVTKATLGRFARSLAMSLKSGVPLVRSLTVIAGVVNNAFVSKRILGMRDGIESGDTIARTAAGTGLFTPLVLQMISVGEETGAVDDLLLETAEHYEREVEYELKRLTDAIEPVIIVIIGVMVLILALGVFLPMWDLTSVVDK
jgi:MSHA biogenesis protein MshG